MAISTPELTKILEKCWGESAPPCQAACPLHLDARGYILAIREGRLQDGLDIIRERLPFPGIIGRVCNHPCETMCRRKDRDTAMAIRDLKRYLADWGSKTEWIPAVPEAQFSQQVAVVGGGPAGLMCAYELRRMGYPVTLFEAATFLGGMLKVGIPNFRLPEEILIEETGVIEKIGVEVKYNTRIGRDVKLDELRQKYAAVFLSPGAHLSRKINIPGSDSAGVLWGIDFLREVNLGNKPAIGNRVVVIGGGNVAIDVALTALRLGAGEVKLACLESKPEMPSFPWEIEQAIEEGVIINCSWGPNKILSENSRVTGIQLVKCTNVFDAEGRFSPTFCSTETASFDADTVIIAIGQASDLSLIASGDDIVVERGLIKHDPVSLQTSARNVFAGGDAAYGPKSVVEALASGKRAAISIDHYLKGEDLASGRELELPWESSLKVSIDNVEAAARVKERELPVEQRRHNFDEIEITYSPEEARKEAERCLQCECRECMKQCEVLRTYTVSPYKLAQDLEKGLYLTKPEIPYSCTECGLCNVLCPNEISVGKMFLELRKQLVKEGKGPMPAHQFVTKDQDFANSESFTLYLPDPDAPTRRAFFPGCSLAGNSPELTLAAYSYLKRKLPGTGIMLRCCGTPTHLLGQEDKFDGIFTGVEAEMKKNGVEELIVACPDCYHTFKDFAPDLKVRSIYELMVEKGLPDSFKAGERQVLTVHDACKGRGFPEFTSAVRELVKQMGYDLSEMEYREEKTRCCGLGGMMPYINPTLSQKLIKARVAEAPNDMVSFCAGCRAAFASVGKPSLHVLDLMFKQDIESAKTARVKTGKDKREGMAALKQQLIDLLLAAGK